MPSIDEEDSIRFYNSTTFHFYKVFRYDLEEKKIWDHRNVLMRCEYVAGTPVPNVFFFGTNMKIDPQGTIVNTGPKRWEKVHVYNDDPEPVNQAHGFTSEGIIINIGFSKNNLPVNKGPANEGQQGHGNSR
ncbi:hypothetical protein IMZ48_47575 [Candidatus Bathyarchaeota archaeon]|nr:hypothetical protein [Candidatus Bathyarchaeota archaeon]